VKAKSEAAARNSRTIGWDLTWLSDTDLGTNNKPVSVAAEVATTANTSLYVPSTTTAP
jgi:hypothetical protein